MKSKILVDGNCVVCDWEVSRYQRMAPDMFDVIDISAPEFDATAYGLTPAAVNREMHVLTADGELRRGVAAFAHIWQQIEGLRFCARVIAWPGVNALARGGYAMFAAVRPWLPKKSRAT